MRSEEPSKKEKSESTDRNEINSYLEKLKENAAFLLGLGGLLFVIVNFHYAVMKIRENEYYGVNTELINEGILINGIRNYLGVIVITIGLIGIYIALINQLPKKNRIQVRDGSSSYNYFYMAIVIVILGGLYGVYLFAEQYKEEVPKTVFSFLTLTTLVIIHFGIISITFFATIKKSTKNSSWDLNTVIHYGYTVLFSLIFILPFFYINYEIVHSSEITMTSDKKFILVEREKNQLLLRKTEMKNKGKYILLDEYILLDINKLHTLEDDTTRIKKCKEENDKPDENKEECGKKYITLKTIKIDANTSYEKKKYILLKE